jgi:hypothetical protein
MKNTMKKKSFAILDQLKFIWVLIPLLLISNFLFAQPPDVPTDPESAPVDGGLSVLISAAVGYGIKQLHKKNRETKPPHV